MQSFILEKFKYPNSKVKIINVNMPFNNLILLISTKLPKKTIYKLKISSKYFCHLQNNFGA